MERYRFLEHTADAKFQAYGKTLEEAFSNAALALTDIVVEQKDVESVLQKKIEIESETKESLLYDFLEKLLYFIDAEHFIIANIVSLNIKKGVKYKLTATLAGDLGIEKYEFKTAVKAMTYNEMIIQDKPGNSMVQVVLDL